MANIEKRDIGLIAVCGTATQERAPNLDIGRLTAEQIAERLHPDIPRRMSIGTHNLWSGLNSSNVTSDEHVTPFAEWFFKELRHQYRALVLVFGTNTAADFGTALALTQRRGLRIPAILVSGQRHQGREGSDSMDNIESAVRGAKVASEQKIAEVMVYGGKGRPKFLRAVVSSKLSDNKLIIYDSSIPPLGEIAGHDIFFGDAAYRTNRKIASTLHSRFMGRVVVFGQHLDLDPEYLTMVAKKTPEDEKGCEFIILKAYETGNVPDRFLPVIEEITLRGTQVIVVPYFNEPNLSKRIPREEQNALMAGAIAAPGNVTERALISKLRLLKAYPELIAAYGTLEDALNTDFVGEIPGITISIE